MPTLYGRFTRIDLADGVLVAMADDTTVRVAPSTTAPQRADLAADVARLERSLADAHRLALATALERDQRTSALVVAEHRCDALTAEADACARELADLRAAVIAATEGVAPDVSRYGHHVGRALAAAAQLHSHAAHRAAGDGVDLAAAVRHEAHCMEWIARVTESHTIRDAMADRAARLREVLARCGYLRGEAVESGEQEAVEGAGGHGASVATGSATGKARVE